MLIYHNHIPRTSGYIINKYIGQQKNIKSLLIDPQAIISDENFLDKDYISGHIGQYPKKILKDVVSMSIIRDPYEQFISWFYFLWLQGVEWNNGEIISSYYGTAQDFMYEYIYGGEYLDGLSNIQTKFVTGHIDIDMWNKISEPIDKTKVSWCLKDYRFNESAIDDAIKENLIYTIENRHVFKNKLESLLSQKVDNNFIIEDLDAKGHNTPRGHKYIFNVPASWQKTVKSALEADYYLFGKIKELEKKML
jgi:hypothetical protein